MRRGVGSFPPLESEVHHSFDLGSRGLLLKFEEPIRAHGKQRCDSMEHCVTCLLGIQVLVVCCLPGVQGKRYYDDKNSIGFLRSKTGFTLQIFPDRTVNGSKEHGSDFVIKIIRTKRIKTVLIYGLHSKTFLCMSKKGKIYAKKRRTKKCIFTTHELNYHWTSFSCKIGGRKFYIGLTKTGKSRFGRLKDARALFTWMPKYKKNYFSIV
ncbi:fibroblast growth factor 16-like isoform X2 [Stegodyphus dumicola]|uniref:fibroblast growth factor 16-like isoform X2 n=1 Tax=Stegodyphus dumicola TaxID=202533 RepID=UPI0015AAA53F|nr:fibroblast growth factor 16-like isoform X2 [Stegodyphus dumicola]